MDRRGVIAQALPLLVLIPILPAVLFAEGISSWDGKAIRLNPRGELLEPSDPVELRRLFSAPHILELFIEGVPAPEQENYECEVTTKPRSPETIPIRKAIGGQTEAPIRFRVHLLESGTLATVTITRYDNVEDKRKRKNGWIFFKEEFKTYTRYYAGTHLGFFFPFSTTSEFRLAYLRPDDAARSIQRESIYRPKIVVFATIYPAGLEPERCWTWASLWERFQLDIGTEVSKSIGEHVYLGAGWDFRYVSLNFFWASIVTPRILEGFAVGVPLENDEITAVPTERRREWVIGVSLGIPLNFALSWLGPVLGLK